MRDKVCSEDAWMLRCGRSGSGGEVDGRNSASISMRRSGFGMSAGNDGPTGRQRWLVGVEGGERCLR